MYNNPDTTNQIKFLGEFLDPEDDRRENKPRRSVYLDSAQSFYSGEHKFNDVAPTFGRYNKNEPFKGLQAYGEVFLTLKPMLLLLRAVGLWPISSHMGFFKVNPKWMAYSIFFFVTMAIFIGYIRWDKVEIVRTAEGRFEEAVIDWLYTVYLVPILLNPIIWYEARKQAKTASDWIIFEKYYAQVARKKLSIFLGNKPLVITVALPLLGCIGMVVTHLTMVHFRVLQVIPYCYINTVILLIGGSWYLQCDVIGKTATLIADDFQVALKNIGPSTRVADYRSLWMMLSKLTQDVGNASGYTVTFLVLYLFLIITLTIYGLMSQIQEGFGIKDIGLTITAAFAVALLFFICDEAHYASNCVRIYFQKKLLLVELSWMNDDAQQEINMFLRATEMNTTDITLGGFFDVNRNLFKSLLATMVTYLVVLLQFQISIPGDITLSGGNKTTTTTQSPQ